MTLHPIRLATEAIPVAALLLFWNLLAAVAQLQNVGGSVRAAGTVMAVLYVVVRGVSLASEVDPPATVDATAVVRENARLAIPAGAWFVAAMVVAALDVYVAVFPGVVAAVERALAGGGLAVVGIYAVAAGAVAVGRDGPATGVADAE